MLTYPRLKQRQRLIRDGFPTGLGLRIHRALSWLSRSEQEQEDMDAKFIFLWIAFNAAYANEINNRSLFTEQRLFSGFISKLNGLDDEKLLYEIVWSEFSGSIRVLFDNYYIFQPFWDYYHGRIKEDEWKDRFRTDKFVANRALGRGDTATVLTVLLGRLYTLRNQLIHGGSTWNSSLNRDQLRDASQIMAKVVPAIIHIMMENSDTLWGEACYPVIK